MSNEDTPEWEFIGADGYKCPRTMDARPWAQEYCKRNPDADMDTMLGWFANSIMAGFDEAMRRDLEPLKELEELRRFKAAALTLTTLQSVEHVMSKEKP